MAVAVCAAAGSAQAAGPRHDERLARFVSPASGAPVTGPVKVRVAARRGVRVSVYKDGRRLARARRSRFSVRVAAGVGPANVTLKARSRDGRRTERETLRLFGLRASSSFVRVALRRSGRAPRALHLTFRREPRYLRVKLNGRRLERVLERPARRTRTIDLAAEHGLRHGRNRLVVVAHDDRRRGGRVVRRFAVSRKLPIPGVRTHRRALVHNRVVLDGGVSVAPSGSALRYRWRLVHRPRGSRARIGAPTARRAAFKPDRPGRYRVALSVSSSRGARASATTTYVSQVESPPIIPAYGLPLSTVPQADPRPPGVIYQGKTHPAAGGGAMLAIDRATTQPVEALGGVAQTEFAQQLEVITAAPPLSQLVAIAMPPGSEIALSRTDVGLILAGLTSLGVESADADAVVEALNAGSAFSIVGVPGGAVGSAVVNTDSAAAGGGVLNGVLRWTQGATDTKLRFDQPEAQPFDTGDPSAFSAPPAPGQMALDVLDAHSLGHLQTWVLRTEADMSQLAKDLASVAGDPTKIIVVRANQVTLTQQNWEGITGFVNALAEAGANRDLFLRAIGYSCAGCTQTSAYPGSVYAAVLRAGAPAVEASPNREFLAANQTSSNWTGMRWIQSGSSRAQGWFMRDGHGRFTPKASPSAADPENAIAGLVAAGPTPYSYPDSDPGWGAAELAMYESLVASEAICGFDDPDCTQPFPAGIRINYADENFTNTLGRAGSTTLGTVIADLGCADTPGGTPGPPAKPFPPGPYSATQLATLRQTICDELNKIEAISTSYFDPLANADLDEEVGDLASIFGANEWITGEFDQKQAVQSTDWAGFVDDLLNVGAEVLGVSSIEQSVRDVLSAVVGAAGDTSGILGTFLERDPSTPNAGAVEVEAGQLANQLGSQVNGAMAYLGELKALVASDPVKLQTFWSESAAAGDRYNLSVDDLEQIKAQHRVAALQSIMGTLLATKTKVTASSCYWDEYNDGNQGQRYVAPADWSEPLRYAGWVSAWGGDPHPGVLLPVRGSFRTVNFSSEDDGRMATWLFTSAFGDDVTDFTNAGEVGSTPGASLDRSDLFMTGIGPNNTTCSHGL